VLLKKSTSESLGGSRKVRRSSSSSVRSYHKTASLMSWAFPTYFFLHVCGVVFSLAFSVAFSSLSAAFSCASRVTCSSNLRAFSQSSSFSVRTSDTPR